MKRFLFALLIVIALSQTLSIWAQDTASSLDQLTVDIWPDYDRPSVLVLITGMLPDDAAYPATVTVPIPADADVNAVAHIESDGRMISIVDVDESVPGQITLTTPEPQFRIEYYFPYIADGNDRSFLFSWRSDLIVDEFLASVQQPILADEMNISPSPTSVTTGGDGMQYHDLPASAILEGETYELEGSYTLARPELSVNLLSAQEVPLVGAEDAGSEAVDAGGDFNWLLAAGVAIGVLIIAAIAWLVISSRSNQRRIVKPRPVRQKQTPSIKASTPEQRRFCHECGQPVDADDRFCRNCGATVKQST
jgi:hypothetical protein